MSTLPNPSPNQYRDLIEKFNSEYAAALGEARISAEHTATPGWQKVYAQQRDQARQRRRDLAKRLGALATMLEDFGLTEDGEKAVKDVAKESAELRETNAAFSHECVERICAPVGACERIIDLYRAEAARNESAAPLINIGLEELMRDAISKVARPSFDDETGAVVIREHQG